MRLFGRTQPFVRAFCACVSRFAAQIRQGLLRHRQVIFRQRARIGARIGQHLVLLVERLRDLQCALGRKTEATVRFALQRGQIVKPRRNLRTGFLFFADLRDRISLARRHDNFRRRLIPNAIGAIVFVAASF